MLEGLDQIDWSQFPGSAPGIPDALWALTLPDPEARHRALIYLDCSVEHQDTLYPVMVAIIPFLLELLANEAVPGREEILKFLDYLGYWGIAPAAAPTADEIAGRLTRYQQYDAQLGRFRMAPNEREFASLYEQVVTIPVGIYTALRPGLPLYLWWMETHRDPAVRQSAVKLVGWFGEDQAVSLPRLRAQFATETDAEVRTALLATIGLLAPDPPPDLASTLALAHSAPHRALRLQAAVLVTQWQQADTPDEIVAWLCGVAEELLIDGGFWVDRIEPRSAITARRALANLGAERGIPQLLAVLQHMLQTKKRFPIIEDILDLAFGGKVWKAAAPSVTLSASGRYFDLADYPPDLPATRLSTAPQRQAIAALVADDRLWDYHDDIYALYGLPTTREGLRALLRES